MRCAVRITRWRRRARCQGGSGTSRLALPGRGGCCRAHTNPIEAEPLHSQRGLAAVLPVSTGNRPAGPPPTRLHLPRYFRGGMAARREGHDGLVELHFLAPPQLARLRAWLPFPRRHRRTTNARDMPGSCPATRQLTAIHRAGLASRTTAPEQRVDGPALARGSTSRVPTPAGVWHACCQVLVGESARESQRPAPHQSQPRRARLRKTASRRAGCKALLVASSSSGMVIGSQPGA